ncbi:unnamed protein product [Macrosiphum euphorbiae]|uniref:TTF-type domain-containing protein n=1 Tax=Macrosiphum euphorbiae TaxID=13131 RepID=A0AAV0WTK0_9HEMI|nr:unnamed protein product [Macrosiphum euphorbiae]
MSEQKRIRLSGAAYRKQKLKRDEEIKKNSGSFEKYLKKNNEVLNNPETHSKIISEEPNTLEVTDSLKEVGNSEQISDSIDIFNNEINITLEENASIKSNENENNISDPGTWPAIFSNSLRLQLVKTGPIKPNKDFKYPRDALNRRFPISILSKELKNGEVIERTWLIYSVKNDVVYCFCCKIFSSENYALTKFGCNDWKNVHNIVKEHETCKIHFNSLKKWMELSARLNSNQTIDAAHQRVLNNETRHWQNVLERLMAIVEFLGKQCLPFRGTNDILYENNNGNFLGLVQLLAKFDSVLSEHVRRIQNKEIHNHYLGKGIQNEIIHLLSRAIKNKILEKLKNAKYYSIIVDCTPDKSRVEQMSITIWFVDINRDTKKIDICEHFLGFIPVDITTGQELTNAILSELKINKIPIQDMRGQGYDNGSNMKGRNSGVQKKILDINSRAFFVPCHAHTLNLVVNDTAKSSTGASKFFIQIQAIFVFLSGSTRRWAVLKKHITQLTLKPLSETRWESRIDAIRPFRYQTGEIFDALYEISQDISFDQITRLEAESLAKKIKNFNFVCCVVIWHSILNQINLASKVLQKVTLDISGAENILSETINFLKKIRCDESFDKFLRDAETIALELDIEASFRQQTSIRPRKKKTVFFSYEQPDEPIINLKTKFKVELYFYILDVALNSLEERFEQLHNHCDNFKFLYDISSLKSITKNNIVKNCMDLQLLLSENENVSNSDIDAIEMTDELVAISELLKPNSTPLEVLQFIVNNNNFVPNVAVALRIILTMPVSVASGERSFSKLKII